MGRGFTRDAAEAEPPQMPPVGALTATLGPADKKARRGTLASGVGPRLTASASPQLTGVVSPRGPTPLHRRQQAAEPPAALTNFLQGVTRCSPVRRLGID